MKVTRAVSVVTYNRANNLQQVVDGVRATVPNGTDIFICDDGSTDHTSVVAETCVAAANNVHYYHGPNLGVGANKNRALYLMKNYHFSCILEDDLVPTETKWFETYEGVATLMSIHHFCRIQDKEIAETYPAITNYLKSTMGVTPIYASSPRGDLTFLTRKVVTTVGGLNPAFKGVGHAHGEWSARVIKAKLVSHPLGYVDIAEARDKFKQLGDTIGGRWDIPESEIKKQIRYNRKILRDLEKLNYIYCPLRIM